MMNKVHFHRRKAHIRTSGRTGVVTITWLYYGSIEEHLKSVVYSSKGREVRPQIYSVLGAKSNHRKHFSFEEITRLEVLLLTGISEDRVRNDLNGK